MSSQGLSILYWNADGIRSKSLELLDLVSSLNTDVIAISETRLSSNVHFQLPGYKCYRSDKKMCGKGQGVAILIKTDIDHNVIKSPITKNLENVGIEIRFSCNSYLLYSIYQSPNSALVTKDLDALFSSGRNVIVMGDFNARHPAWYGTDYNERGKALFKHMLLSNFTIHAPAEPTLVHYRPDLKPTLPDLVLSSNIYNVSALETIPALSSNHLPVHLVLEEQVPKLVHSPPAFNFRKADWRSFKVDLNSSIHLTSRSINAIPEINKAIDDLQTDIITAKKSNVPLYSPQQQRIGYILPRSIKRLINSKNKHKRQLQCSSVISVKKAAKTQINFLNHSIKTKIRAFNDKVWANKLSKVDKPCNDLWKLVKNIKSNSSPSGIDPLQRCDGTTTLSPAEQCEELARAFYENMLLTVNYESTDDINRLVSDSVSRLGQPIDDNAPLGKLVRPHEIVVIIRQLKTCKASGYDGVDNILLKNLPQKAIVQLTRIFNACLRISYYPDVWKQAKVIALKKPGKDHSFAVNYRPISLLPNLGKIFEKIIYVRLMATANNKIIAEQFGFRPEHSTTQQLARVAEFAAHNLNLRSTTGMLLFDIEKAFDTVWHNGLLHKLSGFTSLRLTKIIQSYLSNRSFNVHINTFFSSAHHVPAGVPQGSVLGPLLFLIYLNDVPIQPRTQLACFADDTATITADHDVDIVIGRLQLSAELLTQFFLNWKLKLNYNKTEAIIFSRSRKLPVRQIKIMGASIPWSTSVKYLGVHIDRKLNWIHHVTQVCTKGLRALTALQPILNRKCNLSPSTKVLIYKTLVRPILTYACPVWSSTADYNYNKIQIIQNKALKIACNTPFYTNLKKLHVEINLPLIKDFILKLTYKFYQDTLSHTHNHLISLIAKTRKSDLTYIDTYGRYRLPHHYILDR